MLSRLNTLIVLGLCGAAVDGAAQIKTIGRAVAPVQDQYQYWTTVSSNPNLYQRYGEFQIESITSNAFFHRPQPPLWDGDWNISVRPLSGYEDLLFNAEGRRNVDGIVEFEINTPFDLGQYFHVGDYISAVGWHVEDWGHSVEDAGEGFPESLVPANSTDGGKTEFHPVIYIASRSLSGPEFSMFVGRDESGRFEPATEDMDSYYGGWDIPIGQNPPVSVNGSGVGTFDMRFLTETARIDQLVSQMGVPLDAQQQCWEEEGSVIRAVQSPGTVHMIPQLHPYSYCLTPGYYAEFRRGSESLLHDEVSWSLHTLEDGGVVLDGSVHATLDPPSGYAPFAYTDWRYQETLPGGTNPQSGVEAPNPNGMNAMSNRLNPPDNSVSYALRYAPALGLTQSKWELDVITSSRLPDWTPERTGSLKIREFGQARVTHALRPSWVDLKVLTTVALDAVGACPTGGVTVRAGKHLVADGVVASPIQWRVTQTRGSSGEAMPEQRAADVPGDGSSLELDGVSVSVSASDSRILSLLFRPSSVNPTVPSTRYAVNFASLNVAAGLSTNLGEQSWATTDVHAPVCIPPYASLAEAERAFVKLIWTVQSLQADGNGKGLPDSLPSSMLQRWQQSRGTIGAPELGYDRLPSYGRRLADTYAAVIDGNSVSSEELAELVKALRLASTLPDLPPHPTPPTITWEPHGMKYDSQGTGLESGPLLLKPGARYRVPEIEFDPAGRLTRRAVLLLLDWASVLRNTRSRSIEITYMGASDVGPAEALRRANVIQTVIREAGVEAERVYVRGLAGTGAASTPAHVELWVH